MINETDINIMDVRDMAMSALSEIKHHSIECEKRQARIERSQEEVKTNVAKVDAKISTTSQSIFAKIDSMKETTDARITSAKESVDAKIVATKEATDAKILALSDKIGALQYKVALVVGLLMGAKEGIVALIHHGGG